MQSSPVVWAAGDPSAIGGLGAEAVIGDGWIWREMHDGIGGGGGDGVGCSRRGRLG